MGYYCRKYSRNLSRRDREAHNCFNRRKAIGGTCGMAAKELKEKIKALMQKNPTIHVRDIIEKTGASEYVVLRAYIPLRRELFARASR